LTDPEMCWDCCGVFNSFLLTQRQRLWVQLWRVDPITRRLHPQPNHPGVSAGHALTPRTLHAPDTRQRVLTLPPSGTLTSWLPRWWFVS